MAVWRAQLPPIVKSSAQVSQLRDGEKVTTAGLVICRQQPGTAKGIVFMTLEDEFGFSNLVFYREVFDKWFHLATTAQLVTVWGVIQRAGEVIHVMVEGLESLAAQKFAAASHDFH